MRAHDWTWGLGLFLAGLYTNPATAQTLPPGNSSAAPHGQFSFVVCNKTRMNFYFAFVSRVAPTDLHFRATGWWPSTPSNCQSPGNFAQGRFYYFAYNFVGNTRNVLEGTAVMQCLPFYDSFDQVIVGDTQCDPFPATSPFPAGKYLQGFVELIVPETTTRYNCAITSTQLSECLQQ
jgi:uncharacterized membrane protein